MLVDQYLISPDVLHSHATDTWHKNKRKDHKISKFVSNSLILLCKKCIQNTEEKMGIDTIEHVSYSLISLFNDQYDLRPYRLSRTHLHAIYRLSNRRQYIDLSS